VETAPGNEASGGNILTKQVSLATWLREPAFLLSTIVLVFLLYSGTLIFPFVWDDNPQIVNNPIIRSWSAVPRAFGSDLWFHFGRNQVYYRPLFTIWSTLNYTVFALRPWGWHLGAVLLHLVAFIVVFFFARLLGVEYWTAALASLIFAVHPVHIECVAWISAASDTMVTIFFMMAFMAFIRSHDDRESRWLAWRVGSVVLLACALLTKEMGLTFSGLVALYEWLFPSPRERSRLQKLRQCFLVALPYGIVTLGYLVLRKAVLHQVAGSIDPNHSNLEMALTWPIVLFSYLRILVVPVGLTGLYSTPYVQSASVLRFLLPLAVVLAVAAGIWHWSRRTGDRVIAFAGAWMLITLVPVLYLRNFPDGDYLVRDRYIYLPSVGFVILAAKAVRLLAKNRKLGTVSLQAAAVCVLTVAYCGAVYAQQIYWGSELLLFYRGYTLYPESNYARVGYAKALMDRGGYNRAIELLEGAIRNRPDDGPGYFLLAQAYTKSGKKEKGKVMLQRAISLFPQMMSSEVAKVDVAGQYGELGDYKHALALCSEVLGKDPNLYSALYDCGNIHMEAGDYAGAEKLLARAVEIAPDQAAPEYFLGRVYFKTGRFAKAEDLFRKAVTTDPHIYDYHYWYGRTLAKRGDSVDARRELSIALQLNSESTEAKTALAALTTMHP